MRFERWRLGLEANLSNPTCGTLDRYTTGPERIPHSAPLKTVSPFQVVVTLKEVIFN